MKYHSILFVLVLLCTWSFAQAPSHTQVKCLVQLINYQGEGAYLVVSLVNEAKQYETTLRVLGDDSEWYSEITEWWKFYGKYRPAIDGITGATIAGGERSVFSLSIPNDFLDSGYSLRFETAVEDQKYYTSDLELELTTDNLQGTKEGSGYIRYVKLMPQP